MFREKIFSATQQKHYCLFLFFNQIASQELPIFSQKHKPQSRIGVEKNAFKKCFQVHRMCDDNNRKIEVFWKKTNLHLGK